MRGFLSASLIDLLLSYLETRIVGNDSDFICMFSLYNNLIINQFYLFVYIQHSCIHTSSLPTLPTIVVETWEPFH